MFKVVKKEIEVAGKKMANKAKELAIHDKDTGSSEVQVAQLTDKIENLSKHIKQFKKDKHSSFGLLRAVNRRKKLLDYLKKNKMESYKAVSYTHLTLPTTHCV